MALYLNERHFANFKGKGNQNNQLWIQIFVKKKIHTLFCVKNLNSRVCLEGLRTWDSIKKDLQET